MDCCDSVWNCCGETNSSALEKLQRRAAKIVSKIGDSQETLDRLKWDDLESRRDGHTFKLLKRCLAYRCPQFFKNCFIVNRDIITCKTRQCFICPK